MSTITETDRMPVEPNNNDVTPAERVLIVEDDPRRASGLTELVRLGLSTEEAADGEEALQKVTTFRPAIIIVRPGDAADGRARAAARAQGSGCRHHDVILLTAQGTVETAVEAIKEGAYDYLTKPVDPQRLQILLEKIVERQETLREVQGAAPPAARARHASAAIIGNSPEMREDLPGHRAGGADAARRC